MSEYIVNLDGELGMALAVACAGAGFVREEIVRCRDCKYMHTVRSWLGMDVDECWLHADRESGALGKERTEPDGFCKWGERREDD